MTPAVESNKMARCQCLARRGAALCKVELANEGLSEMMAALKLCPDNEQLRRDVELIKWRIT